MLQLMYYQFISNIFFNFYEGASQLQGIPALHQLPNFWGQFIPYRFWLK